MKIGIEALGYFEEAASVKRVTVNIVDTILKIDQQNEFIIFLSKKDRNKKIDIPEGARVKLIYVDSGNLKFNVFFKVFIFPLFTYREKIDVMLYQVFSPFWGRSENTVLVYDILYRDFPELFPKKERIYLSIVKFFFLFRPRIITISSSEKDRCLKHGYAADPAKVDYFLLASSPNFKPLDKYPQETVMKVKKRYNITTEFILFVGLLSERKNLDNLLRALPHINYPVKLVIVGESNHTSVHSNHNLLVNNLNIRSKIQYTGFITDDDLHVLYAMAKIFCFPSFAEGFGLPPLEAMSSGVPVAVSYNTSIPEVCGDAGTYFDPKYPREIADSIVKLLTDSSYYNEKQKMSVEQANKFSWEKSAEKVIRFLTAKSD